MRALEQVLAWEVSTAAAAVVDADGVLDTAGSTDALPWASVTKLGSALIVLDAVRDGALGLDEPAGPPGACVRHLLAHASGLGPDEDRILAKPGTRRIYSNRGFEVLAALVEQRTGQPFADRLRERVAAPLGLTGTVLEGSAAHGIRGPIADLARLGQELLRPTLLPPALAQEATRVAYPGLSGVLPGFGRQAPNDWGLGFEIRDRKDPHWTGTHNSPRTFGHFGRTGTFLWVDPDAGLACACLTTRDFGPWAARAWPRLSDDVLAQYAHGAA